MSVEVKVLGINLTEEGIELLVGETAEQRKGLGIAHSYFVANDGEEFGQRVKDLVEDLEDLATDVHINWRRLPKATPPAN